MRTTYWWVDQMNLKYPKLYVFILLWERGHKNIKFVSIKTKLKSYYGL